MVHSRGYFLAGVFLTLCILAQQAKAAPQSYITEEVRAGYFYNGTLSGPVARSGYVEVSTGTTQDVLQYLRLYLSGTEGTNLLSTTAFRNVAASPNLPDDRTPIFVNTTNSPEDLSYTITNQSLAPVIGMRLDYGNERGGWDIVPGPNAFYFNLTLNSDRVLAGTTLVFQARRNTFSLNDSISFTSAYAASGLVQTLDTDSDGFYDRVQWSGDLPAGNFMISFSGIVTPGVNFDESLMYTDLDEGQCSSTYTGAQTFTGITFSSRFSRGPIREGIEMIQLGTWIARGFIKNTASNLPYILHGWELYEIGNPVPVLSSSQSSYISPGETKYTEWHNTGISDKPAYYSAAFDWEVVWGASGYASTSTSSMDLPFLHEMDSWADGSAVLQSNTGSGKAVRVNITARHLGYSGVYADSVIFNSTLPRTASGGGGATRWTPSAIRVYYSNGSGNYDITPYASIQTAESNPNDGFVNAAIQSIFSALGHYMGQNDDFILSYLASSPSSSETHNYTFTTNTTLATVSGTPITKTAAPSLVIPGVTAATEPGGGGGGGGAAQVTQYADIVKESADAYFVTAGTVRVVVSAIVVDNAGKGVKDVKVLAYVPKGSEMDIASAVLRVFRNSTGKWEEMKEDSDFAVTDRGLTVIGKQEYREYLIKRKTPGGALSESTIDMQAGDRIGVEYKATVPFGTSYLLTRFMGYSYYEDKLIFEDAYIPVRREISHLEKMRIEESEWIQSPAEAGKPVKWVKIFRVYNPNNVSAEEAVETGVFQDSLIVEVGEAGKTEKTKLTLRGGAETLVNWYARAGGKQSKTYVLESSTPPVLETNREIEIVESNTTTIRIIANLTLENFARERYTNISLLFPVRRDKIIMISDPTALIEDSEKNQAKIIIPAMAGFESKHLSIMYLETPPMMAITMNAIKYGCTDYADLNIFVVPSETEIQSYIEMQIVGPSPNPITTHAEVVDLKDARAYQEIKIPLRISLSSFPSGRYFVYTMFNKDFGTILSDKKEFEIDCPSRDFKSVSWIFVLASSFAIVGLLGIRVYRKRSYQKELDELRKKVKEI